MMTFMKRELEVMVACNRASEIFSLDELHNIKEGWRQIGNYEEPHPEYGYPEIKARILEGDSGKIYIYWV